MARIWRNRESDNVIFVRNSILNINYQYKAKIMIQILQKCEHTFVICNAASEECIETTYFQVVYFFRNLFGQC